jgi:hypothetical protein
MAACADAAPPAPRCVLDNHGLTDSVLPQQQDLYTEIDTLWSQRPASTPVAFQTLKPNGFDLCAAVGVGIAHHAQSIEIWPGGAGFPGFAMYTPTQLAAWNSALAVGRSPSCG